MSKGPVQPIDAFSANISRDQRDAVMSSCVLTTEKRRDILWRDFPKPDVLRELAGKIKQHTLDHLDLYLEQATGALEQNGVAVHFASTGQEAREAILGVLQSRNARKIVKSKSMVTEEIHLNPFLEESGIECLESDLGEFIIQIDGDTPSHIVRPISHKNRREVARSIERKGLGEYNDDPATITRRARAFFREKFMSSDAGITGGNFISAESGRLVLVTNEGNARFSLAPNKLHIAIVGIEKIIPKDRDLAVFLNLLARSATAQQLTVYTQFINGPTPPSQPDGPGEMHVVLLDNGRSEALASNCREILRCIRCGACQNVCPVYRQVGGHAYRATYGGPIGAVLSPLLAGKSGFPELADLPKASSLCGACREVCPVDIPIPDLLLRLREKAQIERVTSPGTPSMKLFGVLASSPALWRAALTAGGVLNHTPGSLLPIPAMKTWLSQRSLPRFQGNEFRRWMKYRKGSKE